MYSQKINLILKHSKNICLWFQKNRRDLPWRKEVKKKSFKRNPYSVWIAEIMLQQTKVSVVIDYYLRWMKKYPTIKKLALAKEEDILLLWQGLGYYNRAKNILATAKIIYKQYGGKFPEQHREIIQLKGIGEYTAGAICSIAYDQALPLVDGNVERVITRFLSLEQEVKIIRKEKIIWQVLAEVVKKISPKIFNEGLMELGATICLPKNPKCNLCPWQKFCLSNKKDNQNQLPYKAIKQKLIEVFSSCFLIIFKDSFQNKFLLLEKRITNSRLKNFWQLPTIEHHDADLTIENLQDDFYSCYFNNEKNLSVSKWQNESFQEEISFKKIKVMNFKETKIHFYTKYKINLHVYETKVVLQKVSNKKNIKSIKNKKAGEKSYQELKNQLYFIDIKNIDKIPMTTISKKVVAEFF